jgi:hypothetical protein
MWDIGTYLSQIVKGTEKPIGFVSEPFDNQKILERSTKEGFANLLH